MEVIRTTGLGSFYTCGYKSRYEPYEPNPKNTYHGDMLNIGVTSRGDYGPLLDYYTNMINPDLGFKYNLGILMNKARMFIDTELSKEDQGVFQEAKMYYKYDDNFWIEGVPDVYTIHAPDEEGIEIDNYDLKCSTWSWYTGDEMWDLNLQTYIYPLMLMTVYKKDRCRFTYVVGDKGNGKMKKESRIRTLQECLDKVKEVVEMYKKAKLFDTYETRKNKLCMFCSLKSSCPLFNKKIIKSEEKEQSLFE